MKRVERRVFANSLSESEARVSFFGVKDKTLCENAYELCLKIVWKVFYWKDGNGENVETWKQIEKYVFVETRNTWVEVVGLDR